jgi:hypothetical protein
MSLSELLHILTWGVGVIALTLICYQLYLLKQIGIWSYIERVHFGVAIGHAMRVGSQEEKVIAREPYESEQESEQESEREEAKEKGK